MFVKHTAIRRRGWAGRYRGYRTLALLLTALMIMTGVEETWAGGSSERLALIVNGGSWASKAVANEFIRLRSVPASHVIYLDDLGVTERITVEQFRANVLGPVLNVLEKRHLTEQIDYVVYSTDFPTAIDVRADIGEQKLPKIITPVAAINALTFYHEKVMARSPSYLNLAGNFYARADRQLANRLRRPAEQQRSIQVASQLASEKKWDTALTHLRPLARQFPGDANLQYNLACCLAMSGDTEAAIQALSRSVDAGWSDRHHAAGDSDLTVLRDRADFRALLDRMDKNLNRASTVPPAVAFSGQYRWDRYGQRTDEQGERYLLSTLLAVTSGRGMSVSDAIRYLRRSRSADGTRPEGTVYFLKNGNVRSTTRAGAFANAASTLQRLGVTAEIVDGILPQKKPDVMGAVIGTASFQWSGSGSTIRPGAICEHLTSFGGVMREGAGQTPLTEFLRAGAAGSSGTVTEPFAIQLKFPTPYVQVYYAEGCSLAEAFYQSLFGPYQLLIVGDPLCQPWALKRDVMTTPDISGRTFKGTIAMTARLSPAANVDHWEWYADGRLIESADSGDRLRIETSRMSDGWHRLRLVAVETGRIATRHAKDLPIFVNHLGRRATIERVAGAGPQAVLGQPINVRVTANQASRIDVVHNGRVLGTTDRPTGRLTISSADLGLGRIELQAIARGEGGPVPSPPLVLEIVPEEPLRGLGDAHPRSLTDGLVVRLGNMAPRTIQSTRSADWLEKLAGEPGQRFRVEALFQAPSDDIYQFQLQSNVARQLSLDDQRVWERGSKGVDAGKWRRLEVHLRGGWHRLVIGGSWANRPRLDVRFGGPGCLSLDGKRFRHEASTR